MIIRKAQADYLYFDHDKKTIDLFAAHGAVSLGHNCVAVTKALKNQADKLWVAGGLPNSIQNKSQCLLNSFFPVTHATKIFYSTGMEAVEFALRVAKVNTGKLGIISFTGSMHGKSAETAALGWQNSWQHTPADVYRLPSLAESNEVNILKNIKQLINKKNIAAIIIEPYQCSNGGFCFSDKFYEELVPLCRKNNVLIIFDEILTGFYRTGSLFCFSKLKFVPDIVLLGKSLGNGFPVSAVVMRRDIEVVKEMLPNSTFSNNPLASSVATAVLKQFKKIGWSKKVMGIEKIIQDNLSPLKSVGVKLRGGGACWILELPAIRQWPNFTQHFFDCGLSINQVDNYIRLLPPLIIKPKNLKKACLILNKELSKLLVC